MSTTRVPEYREAAGPGIAARSSRPAFQITIDTEGDHIWATPREITTPKRRVSPPLSGRDLERLYSRAATAYVGATLGEFEQTHSKGGS